MKDITIVLPTCNEAVNIGAFLDALCIHEFHVLIVDDGDDNMEEICDLFQNVRYLRGLNNESLSIRHGLEHVQTTYSIVCDADGSHTPGDIAEIATTLQDIEPTFPRLIVIGSRYISNGNDVSRPFLNRVISRLGNFAVQQLLRLKIRDSTGRFFGANTALLKEFDVWYGHGDAGIAFLHHARKNGGSFYEEPITYIPRRGGKGKTTNVWGLLKLSICYSIRLINLRLESTQLLSDKLIQKGLARDYSSEQDPEPTYFGILLATLLNIPLWFLTQILRFAPFTGFICQNWPQSTLGYILRLCYWKTRLGKCGKDILIDRGVNIWGAKSVYLSDNCRIDANVTIIAGQIPKRDKLILGRNVSIHQNSVLNAKGGMDLHNDCCIGANCAIYASTNTNRSTRFGVRPSFSYASPYRHQSVDIGATCIGERSYIGPNSTVIQSTLGNSVIVQPGQFIITQNIQSNVIVRSNAKVTPYNLLERGVIT